MDADGFLDVDPRGAEGRARRARTRASSTTSGAWQPFPGDTPVSLNFWGFTPAVLRRARGRASSASWRENAASTHGRVLPARRPCRRLVDDGAGARARPRRRRALGGPHLPRRPPAARRAARRAHGARRLPGRALGVSAAAPASRRAPPRSPASPPRARSCRSSRTRAGSSTTRGWRDVRVGGRRRGATCCSRSTATCSTAPSTCCENMQRVTRHVAGAGSRARASPTPSAAFRRWCPTRERRRLPRGRARRDLAPACRGSRARAAAERAATEAEARETARAFGRFLRRLTDLPAPALHATIPGFHDTRGAARGARAARSRPTRVGRAAACRDEIEALLDRRPLAAALAGAAARGEIPRAPGPQRRQDRERAVRRRERRGARVVDLDTTMPGLAAHDFGDLVRSSVSDSDEDERDLAPRRASALPVFEALAARLPRGRGRRALAGRARAARRRARASSSTSRPSASSRDHLDGDRYYRTPRPGHNLDRARAQLALLASLEGASPELERIVAAVRRR